MICFNIITPQFFTWINHTLHKGTADTLLPTIKHLFV